MTYAATGLPTPASLPPGTLSGPQLAQLSGVLHEDVRAVRPGLRLFPACGRALIFWCAGALLFAVVGC